MYQTRTQLLAYALTIVALILLISGVEGDPTVSVSTEQLEWNYEVGDNVNTVAISADGEYIVAGAKTGKVYLFDKDSNTPIWEFDTTDNVKVVAISADGEYIVAGSDSAYVYLFNKDSGTPLWSYYTDGNIISVAISADGEYIATGSDGDKVHLFDKDSSTPLWEYNTGSNVGAVDISADGEYIAVGDLVSTVRLFEKNSNTPLWTYNDPETPDEKITSIDISADGEYIVVGSANDYIYFLGKDSGELLWRYDAVGDDVNSVAISADGEYIVAGSNSGYIYLFDKDSGTPVWSYDTGDEVLSIAISTNGEYIVAGSRDSDEVYLFDRDDSTPLWTYVDGGENAEYYFVAISADGEYIATGSRGDDIKLLSQIVNPTNSQDAEFTVSSSGADEVVCDLDDAVVECDEEIVGIAEGEHTFTATAIEREIGLEWHQDFGNSQFHAVAISADGEYMVAGGWENNNRVYLFETGSSTPLWEYETGNKIHDVAISADGEYIVAGSKDKKIYVFDKDSSTPLWIYTTPLEVYLTDISADGEYIAAGTGDLFFFNRDSSTPIWIAEQGTYDGGEGHSMKTLDLSADGEYIAVGTSNSGYITLFSTDDNTPLWQYDTIPGEPFKDIKSIAISDDGEYIVAGSEDHNVYFFDKDSNNPLWTYDATDDADTSQGDIDTVDISANGEYIVASSKCYNACSTLIYLFERDSSTPVWTYNVGSASGDHILSIAISDNGEYIVAGSRNNHNVYFFDKDSNIPLFNHENDNDVWQVAISADGDYFATVGFSGEVRLFSKVDNTATDSFTWYIDLTAPTVSIEGPDDPTNSENADFTVSSSDDYDLDSTTCSLDDETVACGDALSSLAEGSHTYVATATDTAGNSASDSFTWYIDLTNPTVTIDSGPDDPDESSSATFTFSASDDYGLSGTNCKLDDADWAACTSPVSYENLNIDSHTFIVEAVDDASNVEQITYSWVIQSDQPETAITSEPANPSDSASATFEFTSDNNDATFECSIDDEAWEDCDSPYEYGDLADGEHTFKVRACVDVDNCDNTPAEYEWSIDTVTPTVSIDSGPDEVTNSADATFTFTVSDEGSGIGSTECTIDALVFPCDDELTNLADGSHDFVIVVYDNAGNSASASYTWVVDTTAPDVSLSDTPNDPTNSNAADMTVTSSDSGSGLSSTTCELDSGAQAGCGDALTGLADGSHTYVATAVDNAGNSASVSYTWVVDTTDPDVSLSDTPSDPTNSNGADFTVTSSDSGSGLSSTTCTIDGNAITCGDALANLAEGSHTFTATATDETSNTASASFTWYIDLTNPTVSIDSGPDDPTNSQSATFTFSASDDYGLSGTNCKLDDADWAACTSPTDYENLNSGSHTFIVEAVDEAGNVDQITYSWVSEDPQPETAITSEPANPSDSASATFEFTSDNNDATFECSIDDEAWEDCDSPYEYSDLADGEHTFKVRACIDVDNCDNTPAEYEWSIDTVDPTVSIDSGPDEVTNSADATFTFTVSDEGSGIGSTECTVDGAVFPCDDELANLADGSHDVVIVVYDNAGNSASDSYTWTIDTVDPSVTIDSQPSDNNNDNDDATFTFSGADETSGIAGFECSLDGDAYAACTSPHDAGDGLEDGSHTFVVRAIDNAGNEGSMSYTWTVDTGAPVVTIDSYPEDNNANNDDATFTFSSTGDSSEVAGFECSFDGDAYAACTSPYDAGDGLADGSHTFSVRAIDNAGNTGASASYTWLVDTTDPDVSLSDTPDDPTNSQSADFTVTASDSGSGLANTICTIDGGEVNCDDAIADLAEGSHGFSATATDNAGNSFSATYNWYVDLTNPTVTTYGSVELEWNYDTGSGMYSLAISADGEYIVTGNGDNKLYLFHKDDATPLWDYTIGGEILSVAISADGEYIIVGSDDNKAYLFDKDSSTPIWTYTTGDKVQSVDISADGIYIVLGSWDDYVYVLERYSSNSIWAYETGSNVHLVDISADGEYIVAGSWDNKIYVFDRENSSPLWTSNFGYMIEDIGISADGEYIVAGRNGNNNEHEIQLFDKDSHQPLWSYSSDEYLRSLAISIDGEYIVAGMDERTYLFNKDSGTPLGNYETGSAYSVAISADSQYIVAGGGIKDVYLFERSDTSPYLEWIWEYDDAGGVRKVGISNDGNYITTAGVGNDYQVYLFSQDQRPNNPTNSQSATFTVTSSDDYSLESTICTLDSADVPCNEEIDNLSEGSHTFTATATDVAGNSASESYTWVVDTTAPSVTISDGPSDPSDSQSATFTVTATDDGSDVASIECALDDVVVDCDDEISDIEDGSHTFTATATDEVGNSASTSYTWYIDLTEPFLSVSGAVLEWNHEIDSYVRSIAISADGQYIVAGSRDYNDTVGSGNNGIYLFNRDSSTPLWSYSTGDRVETVAISANGEYIIVGSDKAYLFHRDSSTPLWSYNGNDGSMGGTEAVAISADGEYIVVGHTSNSRLYLFNKDSNEPLWITEPGYGGATVAISANGEYIVVGSGGNDVYLFHKDSATPLWTHDAGNGQVHSIAISADGEYIAVASGDDNIYLFDKDSSTPLWSHPASNQVVSIDISADGEYIVAGSWDDNIYMFDKDSGDPLWSTNVAGNLRSVAISANGKYVVAGSQTCCSYGSFNEGDVYVFDREFSDNRPLLSHTIGDSVYAVAISANGQYITAGADDDNVYFFSQIRNPTNSQTAKFTVTATDYHSVESIVCNLDGEEVACDDEFDSLTEGSHTFTATATDEVGNSASDSFTWYIDLTDPTVSIDSYPDDPSNDANPSFTVSANDEYEMGSTTCDLDGVAFNCAGGTIDEGSHTFTATATDQAGNSASDSYTWYVDLTEPTVSIDSVIEMEWNYYTGNAMYTVAISADGEYIVTGDTGNKIYLFNKDSSTPLWEYESGNDINTITISADGEYIVAAASDNIYLFNKDSSTPLWTYETEGVVSSVSISADGEYIVAGSDFVYLFDKDSSTPLWQRSTDNNVKAVSISADGEYLVAGLIDHNVWFFNKDSSTLLWSYDTGSPVIKIVISANGEYIVAGTENIIWFFNKDSGYLWSYAGQGSVRAVDISDDGEYFTVAGSNNKVYLFDKDSNEEVWMYYTGGHLNEVAISADGEYIVAGSDAGNNNDELYLFNRNNSTPFWSYTASDDMRGVAISSDGKYIAAVEDSEYQMYLFQNMGPDNPTNSQSVTFGVSSSDDYSIDSTSCDLDGATVTCNEEINDIAEGSHTYTATATDVAGNSASASFTWYIDLTDPTVSIDSGPEDPTNNNDATFTFTVSDEGSGIGSTECTIDEAASNCDEDPTNLADGSHNFVVTATDNAGNSASASYTWLIDTIDPSVSISDTPDDPTNSQNADFTVSFSDDSSGLASTECTLNGPADPSDVTVSCDNDITADEGSYTFTATATDFAGNSASASFTWHIDLTNPTVSIDSGPDDPTNSQSATFTVTASDDYSMGSTSCDLDGAIVPCDEEIANLAEGSHTFTATAIDEAGNSAPESFTWYIDLTNPTVSIDSGPDDPTNSRSATFVVTSNDDMSDISSTECERDDYDADSCDNEITYDNIEEGSHIFIVTVMDGAGNSASTSYIWVVDTMSGVVSIDSGPENPSNDNSAEFEFSVFEGEWTRMSDTPEELWTRGALIGYHSSTDSLIVIEDTYEDRGNDVWAYHYETDTWTQMSDTPEELCTRGALIGHDVSTDRFIVMEDTAEDQGNDVWVYDYETDTWTQMSDIPEELWTRGASIGYDSSTDRFIVMEDTYEDRGNDVWVYEYGDEPELTDTWTQMSDIPEELWTRGASIGYHSSTDSLIVMEDTAEDRGNDVWIYQYGDNEDYTDSWMQMSDAPENLWTRGALIGYHSSTDNTIVMEDTAEDRGNDVWIYDYEEYSGTDIECSIDGETWESCSSPASYSNLEEGSFTFEVRVTDEAGNVGQSSYTWYIDLTDPMVSIDSGPDDPTNSQSATFTVTSSDDYSLESTVCDLDGVTVTCNDEFENLAEGSHTFTATATDEADNTASASYSWYIDLTDPTVSIDSGPDDPSSRQSEDFTVSSSDDYSMGSTTCDIDGGAVDCAGSTVSEGSHTFTATATDAAGNSASASYTWYADFTFPTVRIDSGPEDPTNSQSATFAITYSDDYEMGSIICEIEGDETECNEDDGIFTFDNIAEGARSFSIRVFDAAGNQEVDSYDWYIDLTDPMVSIDSGPDDPTNSQSATFSITATDDYSMGSTFEGEISCTIDGDLVDCDATTEDLAEGTHEFTVIATDEAGNSASASFTWYIDLTGPTVSIDSGPYTLTNNNTATFVFSADKEATFEFVLDDSNWTATSDVLVIEGLADGEHALRVRATDLVGNIGAESSTYTWTVDTEIPIVQISSGPATPTNTPAATFEFSNDDPALSLECSLDSGEWEVCTSPASYDNLSDGGHSFKVRSIDTVGNVGESALWTWYVDLTAPEIGIETDPEAFVTYKNISIEFTIDDSEATSYCSLDNANWTICESPMNYTEISEGEHTFRMKAEDLLGNEGESVSISWMTDTVGPVVDINGEVVVDKSDKKMVNVNFTFGSNEDNATYFCMADWISDEWEECSGTMHYDNLIYGTYKFSVKGVDAYGNEGDVKDYYFAHEASGGTPAVGTVIVAVVLTIVASLISTIKRRKGY